MNDIPVRRGQIWYADLPDEEIGSVQSGRRPVLVTQSDRLNRNSTTVVVAIITSRLKRFDDPAHVVLPIMKGLPMQSMVEAEQRKTISKSQLLDYRCTLDNKTMARVTRALRRCEMDSDGPNYRIRRKRRSRFQVPIRRRSSK